MNRGLLSRSLHLPPPSIPKSRCIITSTPSRTFPATSLWPRSRRSCIASTPNSWDRFGSCSLCFWMISSDTSWTSSRSRSPIRPRSPPSLRSAQTSPTPPASSNQRPSSAGPSLRVGPVQRSDLFESGFLSDFTLTSKLVCQLNEVVPDLYISFFYV